MNTRFDIIIIGTGAGGGTLAYALAPTGKRILILEKGEYIPREKENWNPESLYMNARYRTDERWVSAEGKKFQPTVYHRVGGSTKIYGSALFRLRHDDFHELQHYEGISPAWGLKYEDMEPYYYQAEKLYKVHGKRGEDPIEPVANQEYPFSAIPHEPRIQDVANKLGELGLNPFSLPMGINIDVNHPQKSPCIRCDTCDGFPCLVDAKGDAQVCCIDKAIKYDNVTLLVGADVTRLVTSSSGREIKSVEAIINNVRESFSADIVVVSCGAINSAALLLRSGNENHPQGLANSSGMVGRNLMKHNATKLYGISSAPNETKFQKTLGINDFYFGSPEDEYPLGHVHLMGKHTWEMMRPDFPKWVPDGLLKKMANRSVDWWVQSEDLPSINNYVRINSEGKIQVKYTPNNMEAHNRLKKRFISILKKAGFSIFQEFTMPLKVMNHQAGTCRFGEDSNNSVLDLNCRTHDVDNLYVVDSSFFPSISGINPALTIIANALRVAEHLKQVLDIDDKNVDIQNQKYHKEVLSH